MRTILNFNSFRTVFLVLFLIFTVPDSHATPTQDPKKQGTTEATEGGKKKDTNQSATQQDNTKEKTNTADPKKGNEHKDGECKSKCFQEISSVVICIFFFIIMLFLFYKFFEHIKSHEQYIGFQSIKLIGLILMFPGICILALVGNNLINGSTLAALLGTIAGYVLSRDDDSKSKTLNDSLLKMKKENEDLTAKYNEMEAKLKAEVDALRNGN